MNMVLDTCLEYTRLLQQHREECGVNPQADVFVPQVRSMHSFTFIAFVDLYLPPTQALVAHHLL